MRLIESIILISLFGSIYLLFREDKKLFFYNLFGGGVICFAHFLIEHYRWQMIPAYLLYIIIFILYKNRAPVSMWKKSFLFVWLLLSTLLPLAVPVFSLPFPTGPHPIGTQIFQWADSTRMEWFTSENPDDYRKIMVQLWYPSKPREDSDPEPYIDNVDVRAETIGSAGGFSGWLAGHIELIKTNSFLNATPDFSSSPYPVLVLSHGITGMRQIHSALIEELASNGYVVAALDHAYDCNLTVFHDGTLADYRSDITGHPDSVQVRRKQLNTRVADIRFVLDKLTEISEAPWFNGLMNLNKVGVLGHSFGGATAIQVSFEDDRFKSCLVLDSWLNPISDTVLIYGIKQPFLYLGRPLWNDSNYPSSPELVKTFINAFPENKYQFILKNSRHLDFCDAPLFSPLSDWFLETGPIPAKKAVSITNNVSLLFFNRYLKDNRSGFPGLLALEPYLTLR